jgi:hypothetical protein
MGGGLCQGDIGARIAPSWRSGAISHGPRSAVTTIIGALYLQHHQLSLCPTVGSSPRANISTDVARHEHGTTLT